ncbi:MAG: DUF2752 domain-containing protein [Niabella sp.]
MLSKTIKFISLGLLLAGAFYVYYNFNPTQHQGQFPTCPSRALFNIYCPGCGSQRAVHQLLHFHLKEAFKYNPLMVVMLPFTIALVVQYILRHFFNRYWKIGIVYNNTFLWFLFVLFVVYFILRNVNVPLLEFLKPPS